MRHTALITSLLLLPVAILLSDTVCSNSEIDEHSIRPWSNENTIDSCALSVDLADGAVVSFETIAGKKPVLVVDIPHRSRLARRVELYTVAAPWKKASSRKIATRNDAYATTVVFTDGIQNLLDHMANGSWGELRFTDDAGNTWSQIISSIGIQQALGVYNDCRNKLPPISLAEINNSSISFASGTTQLSSSAKALLTRIKEYLPYNPNISTIEVDAYTDPTGDRLVNLKLSQQRAKNVEDYLLAIGVAPELLAKVRWHGERYPERNASESKPERRVEVRLYTPQERPPATMPLELSPNSYTQPEVSSGTGASSNKTSGE